MSNIPLARELLLSLADELEDEVMAVRVRNIVSSFLVRRSARRRAPAKSKPVTPDVAKAIRKMAQRNPLMHEAEIAAKFGMNQGRVSEILHGDRDGEKRARGTP